MIKTNKDVTDGRRNTLALQTMFDIANFLETNSLNDVKRFEHLLSIEAKCLYQIFWKTMALIGH